VRYLCLRFSYVILVNTGGKLFVDLAWFPMAAGVPKVDELMIRSRHFTKFTSTSGNFLCSRTPYDTQYQLRFMDTAIFDHALYHLITYTRFSNILPSIMASLPVKIGTLLFALNLSNYLLPDVIGLAWRLCLAQHGAGLGLLICLLDDPDECVWNW